MSDIKISMTLDSGEVLQGLAKVERQAESSSSSVKKSFNFNPFKNLGDSLFSFKGMLAGVGASLVSAFAVSEVVQASMEDQDALRKLAVAFGNAGMYSNQALESFKAFAEEIERTAGVSDGAVMQAGALAANFAKTTEQTEKLTRAAIDLSAATGMDLNSSVEALGKTLEGVGGAITRSVPSLKGMSEEAMRAGGAIDFVMQKYGGTAEKQMQGFSGSLKSLTIAWANLKEGIGNLITQSPVVVEVIKFISKQFRSFGDSLSKISTGKDIVGELIVKVIQFAGIVNDYFLKPAEMMYNAAKAAFAGILGIVETVTSSVLHASAKIVGFFNESLGEKLKFAAQQIADGAESSFAEMFMSMNTNATDTVGSVLTNLETLATKALESGMLVKENMDQTNDIPPLMAEKVEESAMTLESFFDGFSAKMKATAANVKVLASQIRSTLLTGVAGGAANAFAAFGEAMVKGQDGLKAFLNSFLASMGQMAVQVGTQFILQGIGYSWAGMPNGAPLIAAGSALAAFGGILSALGGGSSKTSGAGAGGGVATQPGGVGGGQDVPTAAQPGEAATVDNTQMEEQKKTANVVVNVQGSVFDSDETGLRLTELIRGAMDKQGVSLA